MMRIISVGKMRETYLREGVEEYLKRLRPLARIEVVEVKDACVEKEGAAILDRIKQDECVVALCIDGEEMGSEEFAAYIKKNYAINPLAFVIGGPDGLSDAVLARADMKMSLSKMTFTHEAARMILLEQIYRAFMINRGSGYHR